MHRLRVLRFFLRVRTIPLNGVPRTPDCQDNLFGWFGFGCFILGLVGYVLFDFDWLCSPRQARRILHNKDLSNSEHLTTFYFRTKGVSRLDRADSKEEPLD